MEYKAEVFMFNDLWRTEMEELNSSLKEKGFEENKKKPTYHPLHTHRNECTPTLECCTDLFLDPEDQNILGSVLDAVKTNKDVFTYKPLDDEQ